MNSFQTVVRFEEIDLDVDGLKSLLQKIPPEFKNEKTRLILGQIQDGFVTFETRTRWIGFPDYTSIKIISDQSNTISLAIYARSRFGVSDLGQNERRVTEWIKRLQESAR